MTRAVLIVDDSITVRMDLTEAFEAAGVPTIACATVAEARRALAGQDVALAVLDVVLPDGDGVELLREVRESSERSGLPILMLSGEAEVKDRVRGLQTGADDYVGKPYDAGYVVSRAKDLLQSAGARPAGAATVLVIDDSATYRERLREALEDAGYSVLTAASGEEGLRVAARSRPDALIVDDMLPGGIDGATAVRRLRLDAALRSTPCILLTGYDDPGAELRALESGADAFVRKAEDLGVLLARLSAVGRSAKPGGTRAESLSGPKRVLAVDDSPSYLHELGDVLRGEGYDVVLARSGEEALEMLAVQPVDCVLLDLLMPGLGGKRTCERIKASPGVRDVPVILLTSQEGRDAMLAGLAAGADDFVAKSSELSVLKARVRVQIRRKQLEDEHRKAHEDALRRELEAAEARAAREIAATRAALIEELERKNKELEAFSYSVSHDLRAPLRSIDGFSRLLLDDHGSSLDEAALAHLARIRAAARRMAELIDDLLELSRVGRAELRRGHVDLSELAEAVLGDLQRKEPARRVAYAVEPGMTARADKRLLRVVLENLLGNAWKFTSRTPDARIEIGTARRAGETVYCVRDSGAGFDMAYAQRLFAPFQRLHRESEFPGTGIGLATVARIIDRHGGRVWAEAAVGRGASFFFTITAEPRAGGGA